MSAFVFGMVTGALWTAIVVSAVFSALRADDRTVVVERRFIGDPISLIVEQARFLISVVERGR